MICWVPETVLKQTKSTQEVKMKKYSSITLARVNLVYQDKALEKTMKE